ncbi:MAG TPA: ribbon-helix-helix protein, CopG family [Verrucomicrobiae bacterium]|nr:ribbon-helix-helix protein, CopG family [Verrucomicrobiae bacterium]
MNRKKTFKDHVPVSILIPAALQKALQEKAAQNGRSFSAEVRQAIKKELAKEAA